LLPGNETPIDGAKSVSLRENDWNRFKLQLVGDRIIFSVNGIEVASCMLSEPPTERFFGLFRYVDATKCRVRKLVYRGQWPKELPNVQQQEFAYPKAGALIESTAMELRSEEVELTQPLEQLARKGIVVANAADISISTSGAAMQVHNLHAAEEATGLILQRHINGDCDVTLIFDDLQLPITPDKASCRFGLRVATDSADQAWAETAITAGANGKQRVIATVAHRALDGSQQSDSREIIGEWKAGRLRFVRSGGLAHFLFGPPETESFELLASIPFGHAPISELQVRAQAVGKQPADSPRPFMRAVAQKVIVRTAPARAPGNGPSAQ
jgi:hypothetical protein